MTISPTNSPEIAATGGNISITVNASNTWSAEVSNGTSWLSISPKSGSGNGSFKVTVAANSTANTRSGSITVKCGSKTATFSVSQKTAAVTTTPTITSLTSSNDACTIKWSAVTNAVSYTVNYTYNETGWSKSITGITETNWTSDWFGDGSWTFAVTAVGSSIVSNNSKTSTSKNVTVKSNAITSVPTPTVTVSGTSAILNWSEVPNATWYEIELWTSENFAKSMNGASNTYTKKSAVTLLIRLRFGMQQPIHLQGFHLVYTLFRLQPVILAKTTGVLAMQLRL